MNEHWSSKLKELVVPVECIVERDVGQNYEFDAVAIVRDARGYHVVSSAGCSCPTFQEQAMYDSGPHPSVDDAVVMVPETHKAGILQDLTPLKGS